MSFVSMCANVFLCEVAFLMTSEVLFEYIFILTPVWVSVAGMDPVLGDGMRWGHITWFAWNMTVFPVYIMSYRLRI